MFRPIGEGQRYDMVFDVAGRLLRVQCKWAPRQGDCVVVRAYSCRRAPEGLRTRSYTAEQIDAVAAYCPDTSDCYYLPVEMLAHQQFFHLRLAPARNGQRGAVRWAREFEFSTVDWRGLGAIAQLEERLSGTQEVGGSSPPSSTPIAAHEFRNHFGWYMDRAAHGERSDITRRGRPFARLSGLGA